MHGAVSCPISGFGVSGFEPSIFVTACVCSFLIMKSNALSLSSQNPMLTLGAETVEENKI